MKKWLWKIFLYVSCIGMALGEFFLFFGVLGLILEGKDFLAKLAGISGFVVSCFALSNIIGACCVKTETHQKWEMRTFVGLVFGIMLIGMEVLLLLAIYIW